MSRTISSIVHSSIQLFHRFKILLDKKKIVSYLEVFQQIVGFNFAVNWHQTIFSSYHCTNHLLGGAVYCPLLLGPGSVGRPAPKAPSHNPLMSCCQNVYGPLGLKTRLINKDKRAKISRLVIDVTFRLLAVRCL